MYSGDEELRFCLLVPPPDEAPHARLGLDESDADSDGKVEDGLDEAQKMWEDMNVRKYGSSGGGALDG